MDVSTRAALVQRIAPYLQEGQPVPQTWEELPFTVRLLIETSDPEAAAVFKGEMDAALEAQVLSGAWSAEPVTPRDVRAERQSALEAALAGLTTKGMDQLEADRLARVEQNETARKNSLRMVGLS